MNSFSFHVTLFILRLMLYAVLLHHWDKQIKNIKTILYLYFSFLIFYFLIFTIASNGLLNYTRFKFNLFVYICHFKQIFIE